jgi:hypothetical protein
VQHAARERDALLVSTGGLFGQNPNQLAALAER